MGRRKYWAMLPPSRSAARTVQAATEAEAAGLEGVFSIQLGSNPWVPAAAVAGPTSTLRIGTGIALALARPPFETAVAALDLDHLSEGGSRSGWARARGRSTSSTWRCRTTRRWPASPRRCGSFA